MARGSETELVMMPQATPLTMMPRHDSVLKRLAAEHSARSPLGVTDEDRLPRTLRRGGPGGRLPGMAHGFKMLSELDPLRALSVAGPRVVSLLSTRRTVGGAGVFVSHDADHPWGSDVRGRYRAMTGVELESAVLHGEGWRFAVLRPDVAC